MGVGLHLTNYDKDIANMNQPVVFLNDLDPINDHELIRRLMVTMYMDGTYSIVPSCSCGETTLEKYPDMQIGDTCDYCLTKIESHSTRDLTSNVWIRPPEGVPCLMNISFLVMLIDAYEQGSSKTTVIHYLLDPYEKSYNNQEVIQYLQDCGVKRGITHFYEEFDRYMQILNNDVLFKHHNEREQLAILIHNTPKEVIFPSQLPMVHKTFNVIEKSHLGNYVDYKSFNPYMNTINGLLSLNTSKREVPMNKKHSVIANVLFGLAEYYINHIKESHSVKKGEYRKHLYSSRLPWTARMVITSIHTPHDYDEIHFPWSATIPLMEVHLTNLMLKKGMKPNDISRKILHAVNNYDPEIDEMLEYLIKTSPHKTRLSGKPGFAILHNRNPSLKMGSIQQMIITKVKKDPKDITSAISILTVGSNNADSIG